jgi:nucleoside-triphosphatase
MGILDFWYRLVQKMQTKRILLLTGAPGVGKTTVLTNLIEALKARGVAVGGMVSREVREGNARVGFEILDLTNDKHGWLAQTTQKEGPQVGKYHVNMQDLENIGVQAITLALEKCDAVAIDEIGPMELHSQKFKQAVAQALESKKLVLAVVHGKANDPLITQAKVRSDSEIFRVTFANRKTLTDDLKRRVLDVL